MYSVMVNRDDTDEILKWLAKDGLRENIEWTRTIVPGASKMKISFHDEDYALAFAVYWADEINDKQENDMSKDSGITVELGWDTVDNIVVGQLRNTWESLKRDLGAGNHIFEWGNPVADDIEIQKHIDALEIVLKWYSTPEQLADMGLNDA